MKFKIAIVTVTFVFLCFLGISFGLATYGQTGVDSSFTEIEDVSRLQDFLQDFPHEGPIYWHSRSYRYYFVAHGTLQPAAVDQIQNHSFFGWSDTSHDHLKNGSGSTTDIPYARHRRLPFVPNDVQHPVNFLKSGDSYWTDRYDVGNSIVDVTVNLDTSEFKIEVFHSSFF